MVENSQSQSLVVSGESGAGQTEVRMLFFLPTVVRTFKDG